MKKTFTVLTILAAAAIALSSCAKEEISVPITTIEGGIPVIINTGDPVTMTVMSGSTPYWCDGDAIGVSNCIKDKNNNYNNYTFNENSIDAGLTASTATFRGTVSATGTYYAYSPYSSAGVGASGAKVDIPLTQNPTATSFDGNADIMVSMPFTVSTTESTTINNLRFARLGAIVKVVLKDAESTMVGTQHPSTVSLTAESNLAGRVYVDLVNQELGEMYYNQSMTVTANYTASTKYAINGSNATYLVVYPQTLAAGSTLTVTASTEDYSIEKEITVPEGGIKLLPGIVNTLNISLQSSHIVASSGAALPFNDDFSWQTSTGTTGLSFSSTPIAIPSAKYSDQGTLYQGGASGVVRMSSGSATGYLTTIELDLSSAFYVHINSKYWSDSDATKLYVSVDDGSPEEIALTANYANYYVNFAAATKKSKVKITTSTNKRAYIDAFDVISGAYVFPPAINVSSANPMAVDNSASSQTITYSIGHPTAATLTAALQDPLDTWISNIDYSTNGEVTFDVAAQETGAAERSAVIVLSYSGAEDVEVTVNQEAGPVAGQSTLYSETFGDNGGNNTVVASATCYTATQSMFRDPTNSVVSHYSSAGKVGKNSVAPSSGYTGASGNSAVWYTTNGTANLFTVDKIDISSATGINVSFGLYYTDVAPGAACTLTAYYKIDDGAEQTLSFTQPTSKATWTLCSGSIPGTGSSLKLRFEMVTTKNYTIRIDDIKVVGTK